MPQSSGGGLEVGDEGVRRPSKGNEGKLLKIRFEKAETGNFGDGEEFVEVAVDRKDRVYRNRRGFWCGS